MSNVLMSMVATLGAALIHMLSQLLTENFLKRAIVIGLEKLVSRTESAEDDKLVQAVKEAWGLLGETQDGK